jgi:hypothetical protein
MKRMMSKSISPLKDNGTLCSVWGSKERFSTTARRSSSAHLLPTFKRNTSVDTGSWANLLQEVTVCSDESCLALHYIATDLRQ